MSVRNVVVKPHGLDSSEFMVRYYSIERGMALTGYGKTVEDAAILSDPTPEEFDALRYAIHPELTTNTLRQPWRAPAHGCPECSGDGVSDKSEGGTQLCFCLRRLEAK